MATKSLKERIAEVFGLVAPDTVLAIEPEFAKKADQAELDGVKAVTKADGLDAQARSLMATATVHRTSGNRKIKAVKAFRKATGGQQ